MFPIKSLPLVAPRAVLPWEPLRTQENWLNHRQVLLYGNPYLFLTLITITALTTRLLSIFYFMYEVGCRISKFSSSGTSSSLMYLFALEGVSSKDKSGDRFEGSKRMHYCRESHWVTKSSKMCRPVGLADGKLKNGQLKGWLSAIGNWPLPSLVLELGRCQTG